MAGGGSPILNNTSCWIADDISDILVSMRFYVGGMHDYPSSSDYKVTSSNENVATCNMQSNGSSAIQYMDVNILNPGTTIITVTIYDSQYLEDTSYFELHVYDTYTVQYDANGGTGAPSAQTKIPGEPLILSSLAPTRESYSFVGWNSNKNATTYEYLPGDTYSTDADIKLYAIWEAEAAVTSFSIEATNIAVGSWTSTKGSDYAGAVLGADEAWVPAGSYNSGSASSYSTIYLYIDYTIEATEGADTSIDWSISNTNVAYLGYYSTNGIVLTLQGYGGKFEVTGTVGRIKRYYNSICI